MLWFMSFDHSMKMENTNVKAVLSSSGTKTIPVGEAVQMDVQGRGSWMVA